MALQKQAWNWHDPNAPMSLWGRVQDMTIIKRGVRVIETAGHGGLVVSAGLAEKTLSAKARSFAQMFGNYYCFEEDCLWYIPFYENPDWYKALYGREIDMAEYEQGIRRWFPGYFQN